MLQGVNKKMRYSFCIIFLGHNSFEKFICSKQANFSVKMAPKEKTELYHDEGHGKCKKTVISDFFKLLSQRFFTLKFSIFPCFKPPKNMIFNEFDHIAGASKTPISKLIGANLSSVHLKLVLCILIVGPLVWAQF